MNLHTDPHIFEKDNRYLKSSSNRFGPQHQRLIQVDEPFNTGTLSFSMKLETDHSPQLKAEPLVGSSRPIFVRDISHMKLRSTIDQTQLNQLQSKRKSLSLKHVPTD